MSRARADYGDATMQKLADKLVLDYGAGFGRRNLFRMVKLYQCFDSLEIVTTLSTQLSWSHLVELLKVDDATQRSLYAELCARSRWSVRTLRERMDSLLFERTAIAKQPEAAIRQELAQLGQDSGAGASPALFLKDPYLLNRRTWGISPRPGHWPGNANSTLLADPVELGPIRLQRRAVGRHLRSGIRDRQARDGVFHLGDLSLVQRAQHALG